MITFVPIEAISNNKKVMVSFDWEGEGNEGNYNPNDSTDAPLLRFTVYRLYQDGSNIPTDFCDNDAYEDGDWMAVNDSSYCTLLKITDPRNLLEEAAKIILSEVEGRVESYQSVKKICEGLSWIRISEDAVKIGDSRYSDIKKK